MSDPDPGAPGVHSFGESVSPTEDVREGVELVTPVIEISAEMDPADEKTIVDAFLSSEPTGHDTGVVVIKSVSQRIGKEFRVTLRELTDTEMADIFKMFGESPTKDRRRFSQNADTGRDYTEMAYHIVAKAWVAPALPNITQPLYQVLRKRIKSLEAAAMAEYVMDLSGGAEDSVTVAKN